MELFDTTIDDETKTEAEHSQAFYTLSLNNKNQNCQWNYLNEQSISLLIYYFFFFLDFTLLSQEIFTSCRKGQVLQKIIIPNECI